jgi:predicted dehydrogenase
MIRVGIIGCGKIADQHAEVIAQISGCEIVGVCDSEPLMAKQMQERFNTKHSFSNLNNFLEVSRPDVVHITTPPQSHCELGRICLEAGCHIYIEKPFTVNTAEAEQLIKIAEGRRLKVTAGHNAQFTHAARRMRKLILDGYLGGPPVHLESYYCYNFGSTSYAKAALGDKNHWVRSLPGKLLHNIISHGISKIAEFLISGFPIVIAHSFTSPFLKSIGENDIFDELRVIINDNNNTTAYFTFSSQMRPVLHQLRVYGSKNCLVVDDDQETLVKIGGAKYRSYLDQFVPPIIMGKQYITNSFGNIRRFIRRDLHMNSGMKFLIESFYRSVKDGAPLPISYREIILTSKIMDSIFEQINSKQKREAIN